MVPPINSDASTAEPNTMESARPKLTTGSRLILAGKLDEAPRSAIVVRVAGGLIWISCIDDPGEPGERVQMIHVVDGDAQYQAPTRVELVPPETLALRRIGAWQRLQRRMQVRITTYGVQLEVEPLLSEVGPGRIEKLTMIDISAGGAAGQGASALALGQAVICSFALSGSGSFRVRACVSRIRTHGSNRLTGFAFLDLSPDEQAALRSWIYREEACRHRESKHRDGRFG